MPEKNTTENFEKVIQTLRLRSVGECKEESPAKKKKKKIKTESATSAAKLSDNNSDL